MPARISCYTIAAGCLAVLLGCGTHSVAPHPEAPRPALDVVDLGPKLAPHLADSPLPALAAGVVHGGKLVAAGAVGERAVGTGRMVSVHDLWHLGSNTKSMTATVAAVLVARGQLRWDTTVAEVFGDAHPGWSEVTLADLLHHRGGAPALGRELMDWRRASGTPREIRTEWVASTVLPNPPGDREFAYSNAGYVLVGAMLEKRTDTDWSELIRTELFEPLGIERGGFGAPEGDNPWGHSQGALGGLVAQPPGPGADNPAALGPAGTVHLSFEDWSRHIAEHLAILRGEPKVFTDSAFTWLHRPPPGGDYAAGWVVVDSREWAPNGGIWHNGSNTLSYALMLLDPQRDLGLMCASNAMLGGKAEEVCVELLTELSKEDW